MRVALVNNFFLPRPSGSAHHTERLATGLAALGHDVLVLASAQDSEVGEERRNGYRVARLRCRVLPPLAIASNYQLNFALSWRNVREVFRLLDEFNPDLIHQHGQVFDLTWMSGIWARSRHCSSALTVHTPLVHPRRSLLSAMWLIDVAFMRTLIRIWNPRLIAVDIYMRDYVARRYGREKEEVAVIPLGVDLGEPRSTEDRTVRDELNLGDRPIILSLGHVTPLRHRTLLVEALPSILETNPDAVLLVVGKVYDDLFLKRAEELGVADHVITTGAVPFERVPAYFAAANVECHEEGRGSGLGTATLEAMATGVPVVAVASADSFAGMTLTSWEDIVLVERPDAGLLATAISKLFADPDAARTVGEGGRRLIASRFTTDISTADHVQLYEELITAKARKLT